MSAMKDPNERRRRNADPHEGDRVELPAEDQPEIPDMPFHPGHPVKEWHPDTVAFWNVMRNSPQSKLWISTDWAFLVETLRVYDRWMKTDSDTAYVALERAVRARTEQMGMTYGARLKLRMRATPPQNADGTAAPGSPAHHRASGGRRDTTRLVVVSDPESETGA